MLSTCIDKEKEYASFYILLPAKRFNDKLIVKENLIFSFNHVFHCKYLPCLNLDPPIYVPAAWKTSLWHFYEIFHYCSWLENLILFHVTTVIKTSPQTSSSNYCSKRINGNGLTQSVLLGPASIWHTEHN